MGVLLVPSSGEHLKNAVEPDTAPSAKKRKSSQVESDHQANELEVEPDSTCLKCSVMQPSNYAMMGGKCGRGSQGSREQGARMKQITSTN